MWCKMRAEGSYYCNASIPSLDPHLQHRSFSRFLRNTCSISPFDSFRRLCCSSISQTRISWLVVRIRDNIATAALHRMAAASPVDLYSHSRTAARWVAKLRYRYRMCRINSKYILRCNMQMGSSRTKYIYRYR